MVVDIGSKLRGTAAYVLKSAKRVLGIPDFRYYAIADGLGSIFMRHPGSHVTCFGLNRPPKGFNQSFFEKRPPIELRAQKPPEN